MKITAIKFIFFLAVFLEAAKESRSQGTPLKEIIRKAESLNIPFDTVRAFRYLTNKIIAGKGAYHELSLNNDVLQKLLQTRPEAIFFLVPLSPSESLSAEMIRQDLGNPRIKTNNSSYVDNISRPLAYQGIAKGIDGETSVMLTLNENYLSFYAALNTKSLIIEKTKEIPAGKFILYNTSEIHLPATPLSCGTKDDRPSFDPTAIQNQLSRPQAPQDKCVYVFVDCSFGLFQNRGSSIQNTINYIYTLYNDIGTAYRNEQINIKLSEINVWSQTDPFRHATNGGTSRDSTLKDFSGYYQDNFWGNIAVHADFTGAAAGTISGIAGGFGKAKGELPNVCPSYTPNNGSFVGEFCYVDLNYYGNYQNFPAAANAQQVYLITHEMGHLLGSRHTHWCGWVIGTNPTVFGALDNCNGNNTEGGCSAGAAPVNGGTFMSYCIDTQEYMNFNNGFGVQPGNVIRNFVDGNSCIPNCPACPVNATVGNLPTGLSRYEVSNTITANGNIPANATVVLDAGTSVSLLPGFIAGNGSAVRIIINGCGGIR